MTSDWVPTMWCINSPKGGGEIKTTLHTYRKAGKSSLEWVVVHGKQRLEILISKTCGKKELPLQGFISIAPDALDTLVGIFQENWWWRHRACKSKARSRHEMLKTLSLPYEYLKKPSRLHSWNRLLVGFCFWRLDFQHDGCFRISWALGSFCSLLWRSVPQP